MTNLGAHALDILDWFQGGQGPRAVTSAGGRFSLLDNGETPDTQDTLIEFPGWTAVWSHREASAGRAGGSGMEFFGSKGSMALTRSALLVTPDRKLPPGNTVPQFTGAHPVGGPVRSDLQGATALWTKPLEDRSGNGRDQFKRHVRNFLDCVKSRRPPLSDLESSHRAVTICHLANLSLRLGRKIRWDAQREEIVGDAEAAGLLRRPYRQPWDAALTSLGVG
jgi:predicted dehydrogenase